MSHQSDLIATDINAYLAQHERKELLRFITCGSVDDGKSTLIGKLLIEAKATYEDQLAAIERDSVVHGTVSGELDPALLMDGLKEEREQGITIDVAYRYFSTAKRKFIIADTPGHEQYTRNMATGASTADLAIILIDARHGVMTQTKRHSFITSLLGIKHIVVAINKMDLVDYSQEVFEQIKSDYVEFAAKMAADDVHFIPLSALMGDNLVAPSEKMPWYEGSTLMHLLENVYIGSDRNLQDFRFPVQLVNRPHLDFRGFCGTVASGAIRPGEEVMSLPSKKTSRVKSIVTMDGEIEEACPPLSVTITLEDEIDVSRGNMLVRPGNQPLVDDRFDAMVVWMDDDPMVPGKEYLVKHTAITTPGTISTLRYQIDVNTLHRQDAPTLRLNEIGRCEVRLNRPIAFDPYPKNRTTGAFIVIDRITNRTVAAGMIIDRQEKKVAHWDDEPSLSPTGEGIQSVTSKQREARFGQKPTTLLLTGLTGAGKTTIAYALERRLFDEGRACVVLDGQNLRSGVSKDLGFTAEERSENLRRGSEIASLMNSAGLICICAFTAPNEDVRQKAAEVVGAEQFLVVHLTAPIEVCRQRDDGGLYEKADSGEIANFPGVSYEFEAPANPDLVLPTDQLEVTESVDQIIALLKDRKII
ncbi:sulfate adenylyltransferase subunit CysN [Blastopirellula retiformator]|uniref:Multifunctional fusion protein n=1 Tax=Blastopirellula retiformator TaxID=2527970 RepID=A0A5C5V5Z6_9BACT|nr:sulfate adenylyltransferase subunit CysN [Blastopirellula retiformator]TWT33175.1 Bifunctional enzyme CysN/CysC [Blastopirellula retiformator]